MYIKKVENNDFEEWLEMGLLLWPDHSKKQLTKEFEETLNSKNEAAFVYKDNSQYFGFVTVSLHYEYIPGASNYPVGYIEGIYVKKEFRNKGIAKELVKIAQDWAQKKGCKELGSDTWDWNKDSQKFHKKLGFKIADTLVHYIKNIS